MSERNRLAHLVGLGYTNKIIAEMMGVSVKSVKNLRKSFNLRKKVICGQVTDPQLDEMVTAALTRNPNYGEKMVHGLLASKGIKVQRQRLRQSLRRVDPQGVERRKATTLHRRQYHVEGPNSVWHIDGNHKLIRSLSLSPSSAITSIPGIRSFITRVVLFTVYLFYFHLLSLPCLIKTLFFLCILFCGHLIYFVEVRAENWRPAVSSTAITVYYYFKGKVHLF